MRRQATYALFVVLGGCTMPLQHYTGYRGEGVFTGHRAPSSLCQDGYTVDLGPVDLAASTSIDRNLDGLPPIQATIGVALAARTPEDMPRVTSAVTVTLRDEKNHVVLSRQEPLSQWTKSYIAGDRQHAYLYQSGTLADIPVGPGAVRVERFPLGEDDSWGTYFTPRRGARYTLHFAVDKPDPNTSGLDARLQVRGVVGCL
jgi:hypothetical protein